MASGSNLIKWWDVNIGDIKRIGSKEDGYITEPISTYDDSEEISIDDLSSKERRLAMNILNENNNKHAFEDAKTILENEERNEQLRKEQESLEIYERLMREAAEDEAKKQAEIEAARLEASIKEAEIEEALNKASGQARIDETISNM